MSLPRLTPEAPTRREAGQQQHSRSRDTVQESWFAPALEKPSVCQNERHKCEITVEERSETLESAILHWQAGDYDNNYMIIAITILTQVCA